jgi:hypothetical protein
MATILSCPSCANPLRVPDELLGQKVRCPTCSDVFAAPAAPEPATEERKGEEPPASAAANAGKGWNELPLELSLDEPSKPPPGPQPPGKKPGLVGAVELKLSLDDDEPVPAAPRAPEPEVTNRTLPPRLADADDDLKLCPTCGTNIHHDSRQCYHCGEDLSDHRPRSLRRPRAPVRRDAEPHRGNTVLTLGIISLVSAVFCAPVGLGLGLTAWIMGQSDLRKIRSGLMDRDGEGPTHSGLVCGVIGTCLNGLLSLCCLGYFGIVFGTIHSTPSGTKPWAPQTPQVTPVPPPPPGPFWKDVPMRKDLPKKPD